MGSAFYQNSLCIPLEKSKGVRVSGSLMQSFAALVRADQTESIGMPARPRSIDKRDGILAKEYYKEYRVSGGEPLSFSMGYMSTPIVAPKGYFVVGKPASCSAEGWFNPESGKDYEVYLDGGASCYSAVKEIQNNGQSQNVSVYYAFPCTDPAIDK